MFAAPATALLALAALASAAPLARRQSSTDGTTCATTYKVVSGDVCYGIIGWYGIDLQTLYNLNPQINSECTNLQIDDVLCISKDTVLSQTNAPAGPTATVDTLVAVVDTAVVAVAPTTSDTPVIVSSSTSDVAVTSSSTSDAPVVTSTSTSDAPVVTSSSTSDAPVAPSTTDAAPVAETSAYVAPVVVQVAAVTTQAPAPETTAAPAPAPAPTTTYAAPAPPSTYSGEATYFYQNGVAGACGTVHGDYDMIIALETSMYAGGSNCGRSVTISRNGQTVNAVVADECPTCVSSQSIDLSVGAFTAIATEAEGMVPVTWWFN